MLDGGLRGGPLNGQSRGEGAGEADAAHQRMAHQRIPSGHTVTGDDIHQARRQAGLTQLCKQRSAQRAGLRCLDHHAVARHQRCSQVCGGEHEGMIEGHDTGYHAVGFAPREVITAGRGRHALALQFGPQPGKVLQVGSGDRDIAAQLGNSVTRVGGFQAHDLVRPVAQGRCQSSQRSATLPDRAQRPVSLGRRRRGHRPIHVGCVGGRYPTQGALGCGIHGLQPLAAGGAQLAADQHGAFEKIVAHGRWQATLPPAASTVTRLLLAGSWASATTAPSPSSTLSDNRCSRPPSLAGQ